MNDLAKYPTHTATQKIFDHIAQKIQYQTIQYKNVSITIKRLDQIHSAISGNKFFKLKYNLIQAKVLEYSGILTFGGAYSNHIAATAYAAQYFGFKSIGIIRGEELQYQALNPTLALAQQFNMSFSFITRENYRLKDQIEFIHQLKKIIPIIILFQKVGQMN